MTIRASEKRPGLGHRAAPSRPHRNPSPVRHSRKGVPDMALAGAYALCGGIGSANRDWLAPRTVTVRGLEE